MKYLSLSLILFFSLTVHASELIKNVTLANGQTILADAQTGLTLYTFDIDEPGLSNCHERCLSVWPPMLVENIDDIAPPFGVTARPNGKLQLMLNNEPLYFFVGDQNEGDIRGDNLQNVWHIILMD